MLVNVREEEIKIMGNQVCWLLKVMRGIRMRMIHTHHVSVLLSHVHKLLLILFDEVQLIRQLERHNGEGTEIVSNQLSNPGTEKKPARIPMAMWI